MTAETLSPVRAVALLLALAAAGWLSACVPRRSDFDTAVWRFGASAAPDAAFGDSGRVIVRIGDGDERAWDAVVREGLVTVAGTARDSAVSYATVTRLSATGSLDPSFARSGVARLDPDRASEAQALVLHGEGLVVGGWNHSRPGDFGAFIARLRLDGSPDPAFGTGSFASLPSGRFRNVSDLAADAGARVWAVGEGGGAGYVLRLRSNGSLDGTFGAAGSMTLPWRIQSGQGPRRITLLEGGAALVAGVAEGGWHVTRLTGQGSPDPSFGSGGTVVIDWKELNQSLGTVLVRPDGRILLVGSTDRGIALASLRPDGSVDPTFGQQGRSVLSLSEDDTDGVDAILTPAGDAVVLGQRVSHRGSRPFLVTVAADGGSHQPRDPVGSAGLRPTGPLDFVHARRMVQDPRGGLVVVGQM